MRESSKINIAVLDYVAENIKAGMTTQEIDEMVYEKTTAMGGIPAPLNYEGFQRVYAHPLITKCAMAFRHRILFLLTEIL